MAVYLTYYNPKCFDGTPPDGADLDWLGESADGRKWLLQWSESQFCWLATGFSKGMRNIVSEEIAIRDENAGFIVRSMDLPYTLAKE